MGEASTNRLTLLETKGTPWGFADPVRSSDVNDYDFLLTRAIECWEVFDDRPTFIAVDYWGNGEILNVTLTLTEMDHWSDEIPPHPGV